MLSEIEPKHLPEQIQTDETCIVFFYSPLCGTCDLARRMLVIALESIDYNVNVVACNVSLIPEHMKKWKIKSVPCLAFFRRGSIRHKVYAFISVHHIYNILTDANH